MDVFENVDDEVKLKLVNIWRDMNDQGKDHFINQVSLVLSVWGSDDTGKKLVVDVLHSLILDSSLDLSDFGLYISALLERKSIAAERLPRIKRALVILEGYRIKNSLPSEPHKEFAV